MTFDFWDRRDLETYRTKEGAGLSVDLGQWVLHTVPDPSGGPVLAMLMNLFKGKLETNRRYGKPLKKMKHQVGKGFPYVVSLCL